MSGERGSASGRGCFPRGCARGSGEAGEAGEAGDVGEAGAAAAVAAAVAVALTVAAVAAAAASPALSAASCPCGASAAVTEWSSCGGSVAGGGS